LIVKQKHGGYKVCIFLDFIAVTDEPLKLGL